VWNGILLAILHIRRNKCMASKSESLEWKYKKLERLLASTLQYLSDDEVEEIDLEYLMEHTEGLREWWQEYREENKKALEKEIQQLLPSLSLEELEDLREKLRR
jgi:hypothetical protein